MGYVRGAPCNHPQRSDRSAREVLVTVGGGTDGEHMIGTYLAEAARRVGRLGVRSTIVAGPDLPQPAGARLREIAAQCEHTEWVDFEQCMSCRIRHAELVVSMGGYNTLCEIAAHGKPALAIPRTHPRLEQAIRAKLWETRNAVRVLPRAALTPHRLADRVLEMLTDGPKTSTPQLDFQGLERIVRRFRLLWSEEARRATAVHL
jgi:predicted glycosyltransferase